jgi:hypothetical protein
VRVIFNATSPKKILAEDVVAFPQGASIIAAIPFNLILWRAPGVGRLHCQDGARPVPPRYRLQRRMRNAGSGRQEPGTLG